MLDKLQALVDHIDELSDKLRRPIQATFCAVWHDHDMKEPIELWTLDEPMGLHPKGSTISRKTIREAGFYVANRKERVR